MDHARATCAGSEVSEAEAKNSRRRRTAITIVIVIVSALTITVAVTLGVSLSGIRRATLSHGGLGVHIESRRLTCPARWRWRTCAFPDAAATQPLANSIRAENIQGHLAQLMAIADLELPAQPRARGPRRSASTPAKQD